jgi:hypothetical protein
MYKKLDCVCGHGYINHSEYSQRPCVAKVDKYPFVCTCYNYDPAGHNPELENILCPQCRLLRMEKKEDIYYCLACNFTLFERQVLEITG